MKKALFLDRDGVINHDAGYTHKIEEFRFIDGIFELCQTATSKGYIIIVVTNQAGIGRGYYTEEDFAKLTRYMVEKFADNGAVITEVFYCPYHPTHGIGEYLRDSEDRKPRAGMLLRAKKKYDIDMAASLIIGDSESDMRAGLAAGVGTLVYFSDKQPCDIAHYTTQTHQENMLLL